MKRRLVLLMLAAALSGCATFDKSELADVRRHGVSPPVVLKLDRGDALAPADVIELTRRGVAEAWIIRQIEDHGVDSFISRSDVTALRRAGVRPAVIDAMLKASDRFAEEYRYSHAYSSWYYDDPYYGYYGAYPSPWYGGFGATFVAPFHEHHFHHR